MTMEARTRIILVDDHRVVRLGVRSILDDHGGFEVVAESSTSKEGFEAVKRLEPDMALVDMRLPDESGASLCRRIKGLNSAIKVVVLTSYAEETLVFSALAARADGYLLKDCHDDVLVESLLKIAVGIQVLAPSVLSIVSGREERQWHRRNIFEALTARELLILRQLSDGCTYKEVGARLNIAEKTVRNAVSLMIDKVGVVSRNELIAQFARVEPPNG